MSGASTAREDHSGPYGAPMIPIIIDDPSVRIAGASRGWYAGPSGRQLGFGREPGFEIVSIQEKTLSRHRVSPGRIIV